VSFEILTLPGDEDAVATQISRVLERHLSAVGVDTELVLLPEEELRRRVLLSREYDLFVSSYPNVVDPDVFRVLLHSSFSNELGWQNPFGYAGLDVDELLLEQRRVDETDRRSTVIDLQYEIVRQQPFAPVAVPDEIRAVRTDGFSGWNTFPPDSPLAFVTLDHDDGTARRLRAVATDDRMTRNLNPLAIEFRNRGQITGLIYDSLARYYAGTVRPWAAKGWEFEDLDDGELAVTVTLRDDLPWHDGARLTARDVAFTVRFLKDTSLGELDSTAPAPRFREQTSLIDDVRVLDERQVRLTFSDTSPQLATRALTVPILPRREWEDTSHAAEIAGVEASESVTEALVLSNQSPVGSGPFAFESIVEGEQLLLGRYDDHFVNRNADDLSPELATYFADGVPFQELSIRVVRSDEAAIQLLEANEADAVVSHLDPGVVPKIGRTPEIDLQVDSSRMLYLVGFNGNREPLDNPHFRRFVARLLDKEVIVRDIFDGFATPAVSPLARTDWLAPGLNWDGEDPEVPFLGTDGDLDVDRARNSLREAGFEFSENGTLLHR